MLKFARIVVLAALPTVAFAQPLPMDPAYVTGELENGLKYIVRKHNNPPGRAVIWVHMGTGSLNETDNQRGIAHYTEHMAFNGSENFPPGSLVPFFQSLGMQFGRDQNAFTNFNETTYQLSLPDAKPETLGKGMTFFSDVVWRLTLTPKEIDSERGIIQEERRRGLSGQQRTSNYVIERIAPGSLYGVRLPIGTEETINAVNEKDFRDYYNKWYCASNATVMVVADADPSDVVRAIKEKFSDAPKRPRPVRQDLGVKAYEKSFAIVTSDPEVRSESVRVVRVEPAHPPTTTVQQHRDDLVRRLGQSAMNRRFGDKESKGGAAYLNARVSSNDSANAIHETSLSARASNGKWKAAIGEVTLELQRARAFGFTARELDDGKKEMMSGAERAVETEATLPASAFISRLNGDVGTGEPTMSAAQNLEILKKVLPTITLEEVSKRFADEFDFKTAAFVAVLPSSASVPSEAELLDIGTKALAVKPTQETEVAHATELMKEKPAGGTVAESAEHAATAVWSAWLSNNARVHYRFMDQEKNQVSIRISLIGGEMLETAETKGITQAALLAWSRPSTKHLTTTDIREIMTGKKISVRGGGFGGGGGGGRGGRGGGGGGGSGDAISLSISGSPEELETGFQLAYLLLTEPKIEPAGFEQFQTTMREMLQESMRNPMAVGGRLVAAAPYPDDEPRTKMMTAEQVDKLTVQAAQAWLERLIKESPIEITIVGDVDRQKVMDLTAKYLGSLPKRDRVSPAAFAAQRKIKRPTGPRVFEKEVDSPTPQAFVFSGFYGADETNRDDVRALALAARIISTRMIKEVREEAQLVYSIGAGSRAASTYPGFGVFSASAPTDPAKVPALVAKLSSMYEAFAKDGPTQEELDVAKRQLAKQQEEERRQPAFWQRRMDQLEFRGASLDDVVKEPEQYQAMTAEAIKGTFAKYYSKDNAIVVTVKPKAGGS